MLKIFPILFLFISVFAVDTQSAEIKRVARSSFGGDIERFYRDFANEPVIVTGAYEGQVDDDFIKSLSISQAEEAFRGRSIYGYNRKNDSGGRVREEIPSEVFFKDFQDGASNYYVFDHAILESPFAGKLHPPIFLDDNWLDETYGLNLTLSGRGSFTPFHEDGSGEQAWMYLVTGEKHWSIYPPKCRLVLWDSLFKDFYNPRKSDPSRFPYLPCAASDEITAVARGGDLIFLPPGWLHQVLTTEPSLGLGGNIVNEFQAHLSMETGLNEKAHALRHDFDLFALLNEKSKSVRTEYGREQVQKATELSTRWLSHVRNKSDILLPRLAGTGPSDTTGNPIW